MTPAGLEDCSCCTCSCCQDTSVRGPGSHSSHGRQGISNAHAHGGLEVVGLQSFLATKAFWLLLPTQQAARWCVRGCLPGAHIPRAGRDLLAGAECVVCHPHLLAVLAHLGLQDACGEWADLMLGGHVFSVHVVAHSLAWMYAIAARWNRLAHGAQWACWNLLHLLAALGASFVRWRLVDVACVLTDSAGVHLHTRDLPQPCDSLRSVNQRGRHGAGCLRAFLASEHPQSCGWQATVRLTCVSAHDAAGQVMSFCTCNCAHSSATHTCCCWRHHVLTMLFSCPAGYLWHMAHGRHRLGATDWVAAVDVAL